MKTKTKIKVGGVSNYSWMRILDVLTEDDRISKVLLFGSRAMGNFKPSSDIDLAVVGKELDFKEILSLRARLGLLKISLKTDLVVYNNLPPDHPLRKHIDRVGIVIWEREPQPEPLNTPVQ